MVESFRNRAEAGRILAELVEQRRPERDTVVLALPRGGVAVGFQISLSLCAPLDVVVVRKLGVPGHEELAMGAIASGGVRVLNEELIAQFRIPARVIEEVTERERQELARRESVYREGRPAIAIERRRVVLTDDGLATGATMLAAARWVRSRRAGQLTIAVPVGARQTCQELESEADEVICAATPEHFAAVGAWYEDFSQSSDQEVCDLLAEAARRQRGGRDGTAIRTHQKSG